jgi:hypothetical protein
MNGSAVSFKPNACNEFNAYLVANGEVDDSGANVSVVLGVHGARLVEVEKEIKKVHSRMKCLTTERKFDADLNRCC